MIKVLAKQYKVLILGLLLLFITAFAIIYFLNLTIHQHYAERSIVNTLDSCYLEMNALLINNKNNDNKTTTIEEWLNISNVNKKIQFFLSSSFYGNGFGGYINKNILFYSSKHCIDSLFYKQKLLKALKQHKKGYILFTSHCDKQSKKLAFTYTYLELADIYLFIVVDPKNIYAESFNKKIWIYAIILLLIYFITVYVYIKLKFLFDRQRAFMVEQIHKFSEGKIDNVLQTIDIIDEDEQSKLNSIKTYLAKVKNVIDEINKGNLDVQIELASNNDKIGQSLIALKEYMLKSKELELARIEEDERRNWATRGIAEFSELLRKDFKNINDFAYEVVKYIVKYTGIIQGGMFVLEETNKNEQILDLKGCYAYERKKYLEKQVHIGEGLLGTCFLEKQFIYLTKVPENYTMITSGLGETTAKALLLVPLIFEEQPYGVLELASLKPIEKHKIDFIEKIAESIALTISRNKNAELTNTLLEQSRRHADELMGKEEMMRQNMEELHATQEEILRKASEMESTLNAIDATIGVVEFKMDETILKINDLLLDKLKFSREYIVGKTFAEIFRKFEVVEEHDYTIWHDLRNGLMRKREQHYIFENENTKWFQETYYPIKDNNGNIIKVLAGFVDVTEQHRINAEMQNTFQAIDSTIGEIELEPSGKIVFVNEFLLKLVGLPKEQLLGKFQIDLLIVDESTEVGYEQLWEKLKNGETVYAVHQYVFPNNTMFWFNSTYFPLRDENGKIKTIFVGLIDITEQKILFRQNQFNAQLLQHIKKLIGEFLFVLIYNSSGIIKEVNHNLLHFLRYTENDLLEKNHTVLIGDDLYVKSTQYKKFWSDILAKNVCVMHTFWKDKNNRNHEVKVYAQGIFDGDGKLEQVIEIAFAYELMMKNIGLQTDENAISINEMIKNLEAYKKLEQELLVKIAEQDELIKVLQKKVEAYESGIL